MKIIKAAHGRYKLINDDGTVRYLTPREILEYRNKLRESILDKTTIARKTRRVGGRRKMEVVITRQGTHVIDNERLSKTLKEMNTIIENNFKWKDEQECKEAEEDFRNYLKKQGYTRF